MESTTGAGKAVPLHTVRSSEFTALLRANAPRRPPSLDLLRDSGTTVDDSKPLSTWQKATLEER
jgi:hypothetical protein